MGDRRCRRWILRVEDATGYTRACEDKRFVGILERSGDEDEEGGQTVDF